LSGVAGTLYLFSARNQSMPITLPSCPSPDALPTAHLPIASSGPEPVPLPTLPHASAIAPRGSKLTSCNSAGEGALDSWAGGRAAGRVNSALEEHGEAIDAVEVLLLWCCTWFGRWSEVICRTLESERKLVELSRDGAIAGQIFGGLGNYEPEIG